MNSTTSVVLRGTGSALPVRVMRNDEFAATLETSDEWIRTRTGIRERRIAAPEETSISLAIDASQKALEAARLPAHELDLIICATVTPVLMTPSNANYLQAALGCRPIPSFDLTAACTGFLYSISVATQFIQNGAARNVLVVGSETLSRVIDFTDRNSCILFGDGAGAIVLSASTEPNVGVRRTHLYSDGKGAHLIHVPALVSKHTGPIQGVPTSPEFLRMNGREVFRFAVHRMAELMAKAIRDCRELGTEMKLLIPHQVNRRIIDAALEQTGFPADRVMVNLDRYGNTSAASVPIALDEAIREGRTHPGDTVVLVAFGGGLTWGSVILTL